MAPRWLLQLALPTFVLIAAGLAAPALSQLPTSLAGLKDYGAWGMLAVSALIALAFRRGRIVFALATLALAYLCYPLIAHDTLASLSARAVFIALALFVPLNLAALALTPERGTFNRYGLARLGVLAFEAVATLWVVNAGDTELVASAYAPLYDTQLFARTALPQLGLAALALGTAAALGAWAVRRTPLELALAAAVIAAGIALHGVAARNVYATFVAAGALLLLIAVLQDSFRMAFRDELTELPSRRELNERMMSLGRHYTIAMADVDHFKQFNDTYGHDLGDQVLKMVAAKLAEVGGGGKAYRYGGEEFTLLFPGKRLERALPHLEAVREEIARYKLALRAPGRPAQPQRRQRSRGSYKGAQGISVTISIGVAERGDRHATPADVIVAADKALYRAKEKGRNRVSR